MPLTKQSPIQNQGSQPLMSKRGAVEKQYSDSDLNFNGVPYSEQTPGYSTKLSPDQIRSVNKYSDKQIPVPEDEPNNSFSSINDSYNKMFSDYQGYNFDKMKDAPTTSRDAKGQITTFDNRQPKKNEISGYDELRNKYRGFKPTDFSNFQKAETYKQDLSKNPALSMFDKRSSFVNKLNDLWKPREYGI